VVEVPSKHEALEFKLQYCPPPKKSKKKIICKLLPLEMKWDITTDPVDIKWKK
jgi:hypothetical protein